MPRFDGKVAFLTGAASAVDGDLLGFAGATAWRFMREGGSGVVLADVKDDVGERSVASFKKAGFTARYVHLDVTREADWKSAVNAAEHYFGHIDLLVNAAGTGDPQPIAETPLEIWQRVMDVTSTGVFLGTKTCAELMRRQHSGSIVNISSMASKMAGQYGAAYASSRAAIVQFTKVSAVQYATDGVRVNAVLPGWVYTPFTRWAYEDRVQHDARAERVPLGRWGKPEEIASAILFLASDDASYITGAELLVDGGVIAANGSPPLPQRPI